MTGISPRLLNGPPKTPLWQQRLWGLRFLFRPLETIEARTQAYGGNYRVSQPDAKPALVYFSSPDALEAIFTAKPEQLVPGEGIKFSACFWASMALSYLTVKLINANASC